MIVSQQAAEALTALDLTVVPANFFIRLDDLVAKALVISFLVIVKKKLAHGAAEHVLTEEDHSRQTLGFQRSEESLEVRVQVWTSRR